jgi:hypothetical protein
LGVTAPSGPGSPQCSGFKITLIHAYHPQQDSLDERPVFNNIQHSQRKDNQVPGGIRTHNPRTRAAADPLLRPRDHWDRLHSRNTHTSSIAECLVVAVSYNIQGQRSELPLHVKTQGYHYKGLAFEHRPVKSPSQQIPSPIANYLSRRKSSQVKRKNKM